MIPRWNGHSIRATSLVSVMRWTFLLSVVVYKCCKVVECETHQNDIADIGYLQRALESAGADLRRSFADK